MSEKISIDLRIVGHESEIVEFLRLCQTISRLGTIGASRKVMVSVDGDGSGKLCFLYESNDEKYDDIEELMNLDAFDQLIDKSDSVELSIGE
jgi:hypothetical protein